MKFFKNPRAVRWMRLAVIALIFLGLGLSLMNRDGFIHRGGLLYRKRIAAFCLIWMLSMAVAFFTPAKLTNWKASRVLYAVLGIVAGAVAFQYITAESYPKLFFVPLVLSLSAVVFMLVWVLVWDSRIAVNIYYWLMFLFAYGYKCVWLFRGVTFKPADILSLGTALAVAGDYRFPWNAQIASFAAFGFFLWALSWWIYPAKIRTFTARVCKLGSAFLAASWIVFLLSSNVLASWGVVTTAYQPDGPYYDALQGTLSTLIKECENLTALHPADYDAEKLSSLAWADDTHIDDETIHPNVVVVMNESVSDIASLWQVPASGDPLPFLHSMTENAVYGNLFVSAYGGSTCDSEHSFLTATIPPPSVSLPLFSFSNRETPSLAWLLKSTGYHTVAIHPNNRYIYQRHTIYPQLGMDLFIDDLAFEGASMVRHLPSDQACIEQIISLLEEKQSEEPLFIYNVTFQNHSPYVEAPSNQSIALPSHSELENYLNLIALSDQVLEYLVTYLEQFEEPTVLLFFGDHQPKMDMTAYPKQDGLSDVENQLTQYITPFVIWANYPIETGYVEAISINYLAPLLQKIAGLPMTAYDEWLLETAEKYPVVVLSGYADAQGNFFAWEEQSEWPEELTLLNHLRYNRLYDAENRLPALGRKAVQ